MGRASDVGGEVTAQGPGLTPTLLERGRQSEDTTAVPRILWIAYWAEGLLTSILGTENSKVLELEEVLGVRGGGTEAGRARPGWALSASAGLCPLCALGKKGFLSRGGTDRL